MPITLALLAMTVRIATLAKTINSGNVMSPSVQALLAMSFYCESEFGFRPPRFSSFAIKSRMESTQSSRTHARTATDVTLAFSRWAAEIGGLRRGLRAMLPDGEI